MDKRFLTAFVMPPEWEVCGFMLKPFCLQHMLTLEVLDSPIVKEDKEMKPEDLAIAIRVCCGYDGIMSLRDKPTLKEKWFNYKLANNPDFFVKSIREFAEYVKCYCEMPKVWENGEDDGEIKKPKIPSHLTLVSTLIKHTSLTEEQVWKMPIGKSYWYAIAVSISEGAKIETISTEDEDKMDSEMEQLLKIQAELSKNQGIKQQ